MVRSSSIYKKKWLEVALILISITLVVLLDLNLSQGIASGLFYVFVILYGWQLESDKSTILLAILCTVLTIIGGIYSPEGYNLFYFIVNRSLTVMIIWIVALLIIVAKKNRLAILKSNLKLEEEITARTQELAEKMKESETKNAVLNKSQIALTNVMEDLKNEKEKLSENERKFRGVFENSGIGIALVGDDGKSIDCNQTLQNILGYSFQELKEMTFSEFTHSDDVEKDVSKYEKLIKGEINDYQIEKRYIHKNKDIIWANLTVSLVRDPNTNTPKYAIGMVHDITNQKKAHTKFKELLESAPDAMIIVNKKGDIVLQNAKVKELFGYTKEEIIGEKIEKLIPERYRSSHTGHIDTFFKNSSTRPMGIGSDLYGLRKDGKEFPIEISLSYIDTEEGKLVSAAIRDNTDRKKSKQIIKDLNQNLESKIAERTAQLEASNKELESFSYSVSHDLRAPLRAVNGYAQILLEDYENHLDEEGKRLLKVIRENGKKMGTLIDDLLEFSRLSRKEVNWETFNIKTLVEDVIQEQIVAYQGNNEPSIVNKLPDKGYGHKSMLKHVMSNLVGNAIKYSSKKEKPYVEIGADQEDMGTTYYIKDNGAGFDMAYKNKLFEIFQRLHKNKEFEGTGVGLAICQRIIEKHNGKIWADSKINEGATFQFFIPTKIYKS